MPNYLFQIIVSASLALQWAAARAPKIRLSQRELVVSNSTQYQSLRLHLINETDSIVTINSVHPSCGCVLATVQKSIASKDSDGEIYVAVTTSKVDSLQPITIDVMTNAKLPPLRLTIHRK